MVLKVLLESLVVLEMMDLMGNQVPRESKVLKEIQERPVY